MKQKIVAKTIGVMLLTQCIIMHAPPVESPRFENKTNSTNYNPIQSHSKTVALTEKVISQQSQDNLQNFQQVQTRTTPIENSNITNSGIRLENGRAPENLTRKTTQQRTLNQKLSDKTGNIFRPDTNIYTTKNVQTGEKRIETRNKYDEILSVRIEQPDGSYTVYQGKIISMKKGFTADKTGQILEQKSADGTLIKDFRYNSSGKLVSAQVYQTGIFGENFVATRTYTNGNPKDYITKNNKDQIIELSRFDTENNSQTIQKYNPLQPFGKTVLSTEIITQNNTTFINEQSGTRTITTQNGQKVTIEKDGSYTIQSRNNKVSIELPDNAVIGKIDSTTKPGTTEISFQDSNVQIIIQSDPQNPQLLQIVETGTNLSTIKPTGTPSPIITTIQPDGTIYKKEIRNTKTIETFNGTTTIETQTIGNQKESIITTANDQQITVTQKDFVLTVKKGIDAGIFNTGLFASKPTTVTLDFSSYLQTLRKAKTAQGQANIIDAMTIKLTGNKDIINTTEYTSFKTNILNQINQAEYINNKPTELLTTDWLTYFYKQIFTKYYQLKAVEAKIIGTRNVLPTKADMDIYSNL